jgi:hypothetical protein
VAGGVPEQVSGQCASVGLSTNSRENSDQGGCTGEWDRG